MHKRSLIPASDIPSEIDIAKRYRRLKRLREMVKRAEHGRIAPTVKLASTSSKINPKRQHSA